MSTTYNDVDVVFSFDTTGSMFPVIGQVRRQLRELVTRLVREVPGIRIGIIAHGDYCDLGRPYTIKTLDLTTDVNALVRFVDTAEQTGGGGNGGEAYELALHQARSMNWTPGHQKVLVVIGDEPAHTPDYRDNTMRLDWRAEAKALWDRGVTVHAVQALDRYEAKTFWPGLAAAGGGKHLRLAQFAQVAELLMAICLGTSSEDKLFAFAEELKKKGLWNRAMSEVFQTMAGAPVSPTLPPGHAGRHHAAKPAGWAPRDYGSSTFGATDLRAVPPGRFQVLEVDHDQAIKEFVEAWGIPFLVGRGFYEFTKSETIQAGKEIILMDRRSGDMFTGDAARTKAGLPIGYTTKLSPKALGEYRVFVQSTSYNRKLKARTGFLYEVDASR